MPFKLRYFPSVLLTCFLASASAVHATPLLSSSVSVKSYDPANALVEDYCTRFTLNNSVAQCSGSGNLGTSGSIINYTTMARSDYGSLGVYSQSTVDATASIGSGGPSYTVADSIARFQDDWTITSSAIPSGGAGRLTLLVDVTGTYSTAPNANLSVGLFAQNTTASAGAVDSQLPNYTASLTVPFVFGSLFELLLVLDGGTTLFDLLGGGYDGQSSTYDLFHTAVVTDLIVTDSSGNNVAYDLQTGSNAQLFATLAANDRGSVSAVPEPGTLLLLGSAALAMLLIPRSSRKAFPIA